MIELSHDEIITYKEKGYLILRNVIDKNVINDLMSTFENIVRLEMDVQGVDILDNGQLLQAELIKLKKNNPISSSWIYQTINSSLALRNFFHKIEIEKYVTKLLKVKSSNELGVVSPAFRFDIPGDTRNVRMWHQDSNYFLECEKGDDALVVWLPLNEATRENGTVMISPNTHMSGRLKSEYQTGERLKSEQYTISNDKFSKENIEYVEALPGDIVFLNMDLVHSSGENISQQVRYTAQIRYNNLTKNEYRPVFLKPEYPKYDKRNF